MLKKIAKILLIIFVVLNVLDVVSTYYAGIEKESNVIAISIINNVGFPSFSIIKIISGCIVSLGLYKIFVSLSERIKKRIVLSLLIVYIFNMVIYYAYIVTMNFCIVFNI